MFLKMVARHDHKLATKRVWLGKRKPALDCLPAWSRQHRFFHISRRVGSFNDSAANRFCDNQPWPPFPPRRSFLNPVLPGELLRQGSYLPRHRQRRRLSLCRLTSRVQMAFTPEVSRVRFCGESVLSTSPSKVLLSRRTGQCGRRSILAPCLRILLALLKPRTNQAFSHSCIEIPSRNPECPHKTGSCN
jgi:hypothetical protein